jgi:hypothetical protein
MPRLPNKINDKERKTQCTMTDGSIVYKVPVGEEEEKLGHYIESEKVGKTLVFRFAIKRPDFPSLRIEQREEFKVAFN